MNKVIFQIGLLAFCVSAVLFGIQEMSLIEVVARAFIVFVIVVCAIAFILLISSSFVQKGGMTRSHPARQEASGMRRPAEAGAQGGKQGFTKQ